jgi:hypothetical protein
MPVFMVGKGVSWSNLQIGSSMRGLSLRGMNALDSPREMEIQPSYGGEGGAQLLSDNAPNETSPVAAVAASPTGLLP